MDISHILLYGLAIWRVSSLLVNEEGPWEIFQKLRNRLGILSEPERMMVSAPDRFVPQIFNCIWCMSLWVSMLWFILWFHAHTVLYYGSIILAWSAIAVGYEKWLRR